MFTTTATTAMIAAATIAMIATNVYAQEDFKYYNCDGEVTNLNPNFNVSLNRDELKESYWSDCSGKWPIFDTNNGIGLSKCITISGYLNKLINDGDDKNKLYCSHNYKDEWILSFRTPFICKNNIYKLNHIIYNGESILYCGDSYSSEDNHDVQFKSAMICEDYIHDKHNFEHFVRCISSENGYPDIPYKGKCNCLPEATGPLCQYTNKDTCYCNGKARMNGFCSCDPGYSGLYCNVGTTSTTPTTYTYTTSTTYTNTSTTFTNVTTTYTTFTNVTTTYTNTSTVTSTTSTNVTTTKTNTSVNVTNTSTTLTSTKTSTTPNVTTTKTSTTPNVTTTKISTTPNITNSTQTSTTVSSKYISYESNNKYNNLQIIGIIIISIIIVLLVIGFNICYNKRDNINIPQHPIITQHSQHTHQSYENPVYDTNINTSSA